MTIEEKDGLIKVIKAAEALREALLDNYGVCLVPPSEYSIDDLSEKIAYWKGFLAGQEAQ